MMGFSWPNRVSLIHCKYTAHALKLKFVKILFSHSPCCLCLFKHPTQPNTTTLAEPISCSGSVQETYLKTISYHQTNQHFVGQCLWPTWAWVKSVWNFFVLMQNSRMCKFLLEWLDFDKLIHIWFFSLFCLCRQNEYAVSPHTNTFLMHSVYLHHYSNIKGNNRQ